VVELANAMAARCCHGGRGARGGEDADGGLAREMKQRMRINPMRGLDFEVFSGRSTHSTPGISAQFAQTLEALELRDDVLKSVAPKRKKAAARNGYEILRTEGDETPEAKAHEEALQIFLRELPRPMRWMKTKGRHQTAVAADDGRGRQKIRRP
jgi:hypothetical protein